MEGRSINRILYYKNAEPKVIIIRSRDDIDAEPLWVDNIIVDKKEGEMSTLWQLLQKDKNSADSIIRELLKSNTCILFKINQFNCNNNIIKCSDLYPAEDHYCMFKIIGLELHLCVVGTKTYKEMSLAGYNSKKESYIPLLISISDSNLSILNHIS